MSQLALTEQIQNMSLETLLLLIASELIDAHE